MFSFVTGGTSSSGSPSKTPPPLSKININLDCSSSSNMMRTLDRHRKRKKRTTLKPQNNNHKNDLVDVSSQTCQLSVLEIPEEVIFSDILTRLPVKSLIKFKSVSKLWKSYISTPQFMKSHLKQTYSNPSVPSNCVFIRSPYYFYILNYGAYDRCPDDHRGEKGLIPVKTLSFYDNGVNTFMIGSCNGLVCFGRGCASAKFDYNFHIYNPLMGKSCHILDPLGNFQWNLMSGFGYVSVKDDYLLLVGGLQRRSSETFVYVYSMNAKMWRKIGAFGQTEMAIFSGGRGVLVNETLHWSMTQIWTPDVKSICGFSLVDETFTDVRMPGPLVGNGVYLDFKLCEMGGCLSAWTEDLNGVVEMWTLKQYGRYDSWMKLFKIDLVSGLRDFCGWTENGKVLVQTHDGSLLLVDPKQNSIECKPLVTDLGDIEVVSYVRSMFLPSID